jgi:hypothetical protein
MVTMSRAVSFADAPRRQRPVRRRPVRFHPRRFGRRAPFTDAPRPARASAISDDVRLFAATFAGGFLFVSVLLV